MIVHIIKRKSRHLSVANKDKYGVISENIPLQSYEEPKKDEDLNGDDDDEVKHSDTIERWRDVERFRENQHLYRDCTM